MFDKSKFALIIKKIKDTYSSQEEFSKKSGIGRTYISQYMNMKLDNPPKPKMLERLSDSSNGIISYSELMSICGYSDSHFSKKDSAELDALYSELNKLEEQSHEITTKIFETFSSKERMILYEIQRQLSEQKSTEFNPNYLIDDLDISNKLKNKILEILISEHENNLKRFNIHRKIRKIKNKYSKDVIHQKQFYMCPVYGKISAGIPNWAEECLEGYLPIDPDLMGIINPEECFFLKVNGESMNKIIRNGAYALIRKQDIAENGEIAAVLINRFEATLKKFTKQGDLVILEPMSNSTEFTTQVYSKDTEIKILGKYIGKFEINN